MASDGHVVLDVWIAIEELVSPPENEDSCKQKYDHGESESDAQRCKARLSIGCSGASVGFSDAAEEWIASPSPEGERTRAGLCSD